MLQVLWVVAWLPRDLRPTVLHTPTGPQEAVDSAEKWKQFAEGLQSSQAAVQEQLAAAQGELEGVQSELQARGGALGGLGVAAMLDA